MVEPAPTVKSVPPTNPERLACPDPEESLWRILRTLAADEVAAVKGENTTSMESDSKPSVSISCVCVAVAATDEAAFTSDLVAAT